MTVYVQCQQCHQISDLPRYLQHQIRDHAPTTVLSARGPQVERIQPATRTQAEQERLYELEAIESVYKAHPAIGARLWVFGKLATDTQLAKSGRVGWDKMAQEWGYDDEGRGPILTDTSYQGAYAHPGEQLQADVREIARLRKSIARERRTLTGNGA